MMPALMNLLFSMSLQAGSSLPSAVTWQVGKHEGNQISLTTEKTSTLIATRVNTPDAIRALDKVSAEKIWQDWQSLGLPAMKSTSLQSCGDLLLVTEKRGKKENRIYYCGDKLLKSQKLQFKEFYEKLLALSLDPKKKY